MRIRGEGASVSQICSAAQISRRTFFNWLSRYEEDGLKNLTDKRRSPYTTHRTPDETIKAVMNLRRETGWEEYSQT
jgi:transposase